MNNETLVLVLVRTVWSLQSKAVSLSLPALHPMKSSWILQQRLRTLNLTFTIDLSLLSILFSQYRSCDDTEESTFFQSWAFSRSHAVFLMNMTTIRHMIYIGKTKWTSEKGLLNLIVINISVNRLLASSVNSVRSFLIHHPCIKIFSLKNVERAMGSSPRNQFWAVEKPYLLRSRQICFSAVETKLNIHGFHKAFTISREKEKRKAT